MRDLLGQAESAEARVDGAWAFRALVENIEQCVYLLDSECRYLAVNRAFSAWLKRPEAEILGHTVFDLWPRPLAVKEAAEHQRVLHGEQIEQEEEWPGGGTVPSPVLVRIRKVPMRDEEGRVRGVLCLFRETTSGPSRVSASNAVSPSASQTRTTKTILMVDNERSIVQLAQTVLQIRGYRVWTAEEGQQAVDICRQDPTAIDVVVIDQNMPGLSGLETIEQLLALNPRLRIVLTTGGAPPESWEANTPGRGFLSKPWSNEQLLQAVRDV